MDVSRKIVKRLFKKHGYVKRKAQKVIGIGTCKYREVQKVFDHDFPHLADGIVIPHGLYDVVRNTAYVNIGTSKDTSEFACDSIRQWWYNEGQHNYPDAGSILLLCDAGGSNSYRHYIFKADIQKLADEIGIEIRIAHYPSYASKWNPIEHRLFCHVTRALDGVIFKSHELVKDLIESTTTKTGLTVTANIIKRVYQTGRKVAANFKGKFKLFSENIFCNIINRLAKCTLRD